MAAVPSSWGWGAFEALSHERFSDEDERGRDTARFRILIF